MFPLFALACGGTSEGSPPQTESSASTFADVAPATGSVSLPSPHADKKISGFVFTNDGTSDITISQIEVTLATGAVIHGSAGVGVAAGTPITFLFDTSTTHEVSKLAFVVDGTTAKLVVTETDQTGIVPSTSVGPSR